MTAIRARLGFRMRIKIKRLSFRIKIKRLSFRIKIKRLSFGIKIKFQDC
jgi:polyisoprenoid-binding protein YceI